MLTTRPAARDLDVTATYADMAAARRAIDALQFAGFDPAEIRLLGAAAEAARRAEARTNMSDRDVPLVWRVLGRGILWSIVGTPVGAVIGVVLAVAGAVVINWWFTVLMWALFGHFIGGMWGAYAALSIGDAWEMTFERVEGAPIVVSVRVADAAAAGRAERALRAHGPAGVGVTPATA